MAQIAVVYHSGYGHTKLQAEAVHRGAASVKGVEAQLLTTEEAIQRLDDLDKADAISFQVAPPGAPGKGDLETAQAYGARVAEITLQFLRGRKA